MERGLTIEPLGKDRVEPRAKKRVSVADLGENFRERRHDA